MRRIVFLCAALLIAVSASTAAIVRYRTHGPSDARNFDLVLAAENVLQDPKASKGLFDNAQEGEYGKALWLTVTPTRFEPARVSLPADQYFLLVQNDTGLDRFGLVVPVDQCHRF